MKAIFVKESHILELEKALKNNDKETIKSLLKNKKAVITDTETLK